MQKSRYLEEIFDFENLIASRVIKQLFIDNLVKFIMSLGLYCMTEGKIKQIEINFEPEMGINR